MPWLILQDFCVLWDLQKAVEDLRLALARRRSAESRAATAGILSGPKQKATGDVIETSSEAGSNPSNPGEVGEGCHRDPPVGIASDSNKGGVREGCSGGGSPLRWLWPRRPGADGEPPELVQLRKRVHGQEDRIRALLAGGKREAVCAFVVCFRISSFSFPDFFQPHLIACRVATRK